MRLYIIYGDEFAHAVAHHAYPCTASMDVDPEFNEPILHIAGYNIREAVKDAIKRGRKRRKGET